MLNVRIKSRIGDTANIDHLCIDIKNNTFAGIYGNSKHVFMSLLSGMIGFDGDVILDSISLKGNYEEYLDQVAVITKDSVIDSELSVNDFLDFFGTISNSYRDSYEERKNELLDTFGLQASLNTSIAYLKEKDRRLIVLISLFLQERTLVILDTFLDSFCKSDINKITHYLYNYANKDKIVLIGSDDYQLLKSVSETIYIVD